MIFKPPARDQIPLLRSLWKTAFGDTDDYLDAFFSTAFSPERSLCAFHGDALAGMLFWFDVTCADQKMAYVYAVATAPEYRGQGICRELMAQTHELLRSQGYTGSMLVPVTDDLRAMYASFGYAEGTNIGETFCAAGNQPVSLHGIDADEYARQRRQLLPPGAVIQEGENLALLETQVKFYRGTDFLLTAQSTEEGALFAAELLGNASAAPGILRALGYAQGTFRTPGTSMAYAMFCPLAEHAAVPTYFAFSFD